jgi:hypothetical protein
MLHAARGEGKQVGREGLDYREVAAIRNGNWKRGTNPLWTVKQIKTQNGVSFQEVSMKNSGLRKYRWWFFAFAIGGIIQSPFVFPAGVAQAVNDHRLSLPFGLALVIRCSIIGALLKVWWDTRSSTGTQENASPATATKSDA